MSKRLLVLAVAIPATVAACTIEVQTGRPEITIGCVLVELPGGEVRDCDGGLSYLPTATPSPDDAGDEATSGESASPAAPPPEPGGGASMCRNCQPGCACDEGLNPKPL